MEALGLQIRANQIEVALGRAPAGSQRAGTG